MAIVNGYPPACAARLLVILLFSLALASCSDPAKENATRLRLANFLWGTDQVQVLLYRGEKQEKEVRLSYGSLSKYHSLEPGRYRLRVVTGKQAILEKTFGLGTRESYTLFIAGISTGPQKLNRQTLDNKLHTLVEGSATRTDNGYLPQVLLVNDFFVKEKHKGQFRVINLMPGATHLEGKLIKGDSKEFSSTLKYFHSSHTKPVPTGELQLELLFSGSPLRVIREPVTIRQQVLNSFFIIPRKGHYLTSPMIVNGITEDFP
ncbi:DUF4397 domain-containing protein [Microbulbifer yueqingensis]|uniref:DUF4397 domain-containing protein n=1 Tax=Microbulbifer yueqingensis TaxID=658219 RepID=A0A1G8ZF61_9GAMM|nr:DUF4397 domain-containing protein [Microbulbifer yueqingensis]SDK12800.1 hypothetical protein SAMN05216212_1565 [Microbulbifer yueqingensis]